MRILLTGGGSGGHLYPLVAVADKLKEKLGSEAEFLYIGSGAKMEKEVMQKEGIRAKHVLSGKFRRYASFKNILDFFKLPIGFLQSLWILLWNMPDVIFSKGGYVAAPVVLAAWLYRIPVMIHESDASPGLANQFLSRFSNRIAVAYPSAENYFPKEKTALIGNPVRPEVLGGDPYVLRKELQFSESKKILLVLGGSQGARVINQSLINMLPKLLQHYQIIHQTGEKNYDEVIVQVGEEGIKIGRDGYVAYKFLEANLLRDAYALCDLVISRAGASSVSEIAANGKASILIPLEGAANDHQRMNAYALAEIGAAMVLEETNLKEHILTDAIGKILDNQEVSSAMSEKIKTFYHPAAAEVIAKGLIELARS